MVAVDPVYAINTPSDVSLVREVPSPSSDAWRALAAAVAQRPHMRVSRDGGRTYPASRIRRITVAPPNQPAAVPTFDQLGTTRCVVFDLDAHTTHTNADHATQQAVLHDLHALQALIGPDNLIVDRSPNGGHHAYLMLPNAAPAWEVRQVITYLAEQLTTLDPTCMLNPAAGLIRPPGARHSSGGNQELITPLPHAVHLITVGVPDTIWPTLTAHSLNQRISNVQPDHDETTDSRDRATGLSKRIITIATTGDATGYRSRSEARQAVLTACVRNHWNLSDVTARIEDGRWPGLAGMYARYGHRHERQALTRDWRKALAWTPKPTKSHRSNYAHLRNTRGHKSHPQRTGPYQEIRTWQSAATIAERSRWRNEPTTTLVIRALGRIAELNASMACDHGDRALSLATGLDIATVSRILARLRDEPEPLIHRVQEDRGIRADVYELHTPPSLRDAADRRPWRPGQVHALRPVFLELGRVAAFTYEALETTNQPLTLSDMSEIIPYSTSAIRESLHTLEQWGLVKRCGRAWRQGPRTPDAVAEQVGAVATLHNRVTLYRRQRHEYRLWLASRGHIHALVAELATAQPAQNRHHDPWNGEKDGWGVHDPLTSTLRGDGTEAAGQIAVELVTSVLGAQLMCCQL